MACVYAKQKTSAIKKTPTNAFKLYNIWVRQTIKQNQGELFMNIACTWCCCRGAVDKMFCGKFIANLVLRM